MRVLVAFAILFAGCAGTTPEIEPTEKIGEGPLAAQAIPWGNLEAPIRPGVSLLSGDPWLPADPDGSYCTANFMFTNGTQVLVGTAQHCILGEGKSNACDRPDAIGQELWLQGAHYPVRVVYHTAWHMRLIDADELDPDCRLDFALLALDPRDIPRANPTVRMWGGPTGLAVGDPAPGGLVYSYGNSAARPFDVSNYQAGNYLGRGQESSNLHRFNLIGAVPGDSGAGVMDDEGRALSHISAIYAFPEQGLAGADISYVLDTIEEDLGWDLELALGEAWNGPIES